jgi:hypothetical protein
VQSLVKLVQGVAEAGGDLDVEHVFQVFRIGAHEAELDRPVSDQDLHGTFEPL